MRKVDSIQQAYGQGQVFRIDFRILFLAFDGKRLESTENSRIGNVVLNAGKP